MADLFRVTAPRLVRRSDGAQHIMAECFPLLAASGLVYFELYWNLQRPATRAIHILQGDIKGDGPWKIADAIITLVGCQSTHPELASSYAEWQSYLQLGAPSYPEIDAVHALARSVGARVDV